MNLNVLHRRLVQDVLEIGKGLREPPAVTPSGPVLALYDVIGTKVRGAAAAGRPRW